MPVKSAHSFPDKHVHTVMQKGHAGFTYKVLKCTSILVHNCCMLFCLNDPRTYSESLIHTCVHECVSLKEICRTHAHGRSILFSSYSRGLWLSHWKPQRVTLTLFQALMGSAQCVSIQTWQSLAVKRIKADLLSPLFAWLDSSETPERFFIIPALCLRPP